MEANPVTEAKFFVMAAKGPNPKVKEYKRRRHHNKNRLGCVSCRQKRVKCDQGKPTCARCGRSGAPCRYEAALSVPVPSSSSSAVLPKPLPEWSTTLAESILQPRLLRAAGRTTAPQLPLQALLGHAAQRDVFGLPLTPTLWQLACQHPHLLASILAISACRLRLTVPDGHAVRVAECALEAVALGDFQPALAAAAPLTQSRSDALLLTSMLLNHLAFASVSDDDGRGGGYLSVSSPSSPNNPQIHNSRRSSSSTNGLEWLALSMGLRPLLAATRAFHGAGSALAPIFAASDDENGTFSRSHEEDLGGAPAHWAWLVSSSSSSGSPSSTATTLGSKEWCLREPLGTLAAMRALPPVVENGLKYVQFVGKLEAAFMEMLRDRDERAMWMLGYWLALMGQLSPWWSGGRVRRDGAAIRTFLVESRGVCGRGEEEGEMWRLLMRDYDSVYRTVLL